MWVGILSTKMKSKGKGLGDAYTQHTHAVLMVEGQPHPAVEKFSKTRTLKKLRFEPEVRVSG